MFGFGRVAQNRRALFSLFGALLALVFLGYQAIPEKPDLSPRVAFAKALTVTMQAESYRYRMAMKTVNNSEEDFFSSIKGEKAAIDMIHVWGKIKESSMDFYQIKNTSYIKDDLSGEWTKSENNELNLTEIFLVEINPFYNLGYKELTTVDFKGNSEIAGVKYWHYSARPVVDNPSREALWRDFSYDIWVERDSYRIRKAVVEATSKNNADYKLVLTMEFADYNENIEIKPPV